MSVLCPKQCKALFRLITNNWSGDHDKTIDKILRYVTWERYSIQEESPKLNTSVITEKLDFQQNRYDENYERFLKTECDV